MRRLLGPGPESERAAEAAARAFTFDVPLVEVEPGRFVLELFHGPTCAFKDVGARFMAALMESYRGDADASGSRCTILVATSGDTGGAVADAFHGGHGIRVVTLFPRRGISERQRRQMSTLRGNVHAVAVDGTFDDCQRMAKEAFGDRSLRHEHGLTSANSINVGRLLPQTAYYVHAAALLGWEDRPARFVVPSGNLGNVCAGLMAHEAGMPAEGFLAATNRNDAFPRWLEGGDGGFRAVATISNAMDVARPSNLERIERLFGGRDGVRAAVDGIAISEEDTRSCIREVHARTGYVLDPHTAFGWAAADRRRGAGTDVVLATAHPAKFPDVVEAETGTAVPLPPALARRMTAPERIVECAPTTSALRHVLASLPR